MRAREDKGGQGGTRGAWWGQGQGETEGTVRGGEDGCSWGALVGCCSAQTHGWAASRNMLEVVAASRGGKRNLRWVPTS